MLVGTGPSESNELFVEILGLFEQEGSQKMEEIRSFSASADFFLLGRAAHALAGSSANIGGREVWRQAKAIENLCKQGQGTEAAGLIPKLERTYDQTVRALREFA